MTFYLLAFVVALAIFGLIRSPNARERLHLRSIYIWSSEVILKQLRSYHQQFLECLGLNDEENIDILEISIDDYDEPVIEEIERSDSIEEIQGIRLRSHLIDYQNRPESDTLAVPESAAAEETGQISGNGSRPADGLEPEEREKVLAAITASLHRLSSAASSGKMNGGQLYEILLQATLLHDNAMRGENLRAPAAADGAPSAPEEEALQQQGQSPEEGAETPKVRMYFGQSPLEYTPHQK